MLRFTFFSFFFNNKAKIENFCFYRSGPMGIFHLVTHYTRWFFYPCEGVDPNRNFGFHWGEEDEGAASSDPCHETYAGPKAFSEPETRAIADYILANKKSIK